MRVPVSWLRDLVPGLDVPVEEVAEALVRAGLEVEQVERVGNDVSGVVVGRVLDVEELTEFKKPIRFCHVDVGERVHDVVCGATNFVAGDVVPFALPGAELPGGFRIATRQTYGRTSDGMICSASELGLEEGRSDGILVLGDDLPLGADVVELLGLRDEVLDIAVTPDRGYCLSVRGVAREAAIAFGLELRDPAALEVPAVAGGPEVVLEDPGCSRYVARVVTGLDPSASSPAWLQRRLVLAGMRPVSLAVDVTNAVMLETGQPLHAFDADRLSGAVRVRRARAGERIVTLDGQDRLLDQGDLVIADDTGAVAIAGVMGGASTEVSPSTTALLLESAHFDAVSVARTQRRHRLPSEASKRFERGVDPALAPAAAELAVRLLVELGGAAAAGGTDAGSAPQRREVRSPVDLPTRVAGREVTVDAVVRRLEQVGCDVVVDGDVLTAAVPTWRPDLRIPVDLVEEVLRLEGYESVPSRLPQAPAGRGLTAAQRLRRTASRALAAAGLVECVTPPFVGPAELEVLGLADPLPPRLANPLSAEQALLRPSLLPGLLAALRRATGRGLHDVRLFETGLVQRPPAGPPVPPPRVDVRPDDDEVAALDLSLPVQPRLAALVLSGAEWSDAVEAVVALGRALSLDLALTRGDAPAFHPGRCAAVVLDGEVIGFSGELHPRVVSGLGLPARTCAAEVDLGALVDAAVKRGVPAAPVVSPYPPAGVDVALVVDEHVLAAEVEAALRHGAGPLLEELRLFDVYTGPQVGEGKRSLAFSLRFRAPDRTLVDTEVLAARDAAVAAAAERTGAVLRG